MRMPVRLRPQPNQPVWKVNDRPESVDEAFDAFIGGAGGRNVRGRDLLDEEVKVYYRPYAQGARCYDANSTRSGNP